MRRDLNLTIPTELRQAEELLEKYGRWAQDRWKKQRCASAEGKYAPPPQLIKEREPAIEPCIPDWSAREVQLALQIVPMQYRRVLFAYYVPQKSHHHAVRRQLGISSSTWERSRIEGVRQFWSIYRLHYLTR